MFEDLENKLILDLSHTHFLLNIYFQKTIFPGLIKSIFFCQLVLTNGGNLQKNINVKFDPSEN